MISELDAEDATIVVEQAEDLMTQINQWLVEWWAIIEYGKLGGDGAAVHPQGS